MISFLYFALNMEINDNDKDDLIFLDIINVYSERFFVKNLRLFSKYI